MKPVKPLNNHKYLLVFVHGFTGSEDTWIRTDSKKSVLEYLADDSQIRKFFDISMFLYTSTFFDTPLKLKYLLKSLFGNSRGYKRNLAIKALAKGFLSELQHDARNYDGVVIIAHSLGGLIAKHLIIDEIEQLKETRGKSKVKLYITLATPHFGAELASFGKLLSINKQIQNLRPTNEELLDLNNAWVQSKRLPKTIYVECLNDQIVPSGAGGIDRKKNISIVSKDDDHFTVLTPSQQNKHVLNRIKIACLDLVKESGIDTGEPIEIEVIDNNEYIDLPVPPVIPLNTKWKYVVILIVLIGAFFLWKGWENNPMCAACPILDSTGMTGYFLKKYSDTSLNVIDFNPADTNNLSDPTFQNLEEFIKNNVGTKNKILDSDFISYVKLNPPENEMFNVLRFVLPSKKSNWGGFEIGIDTIFYKRKSLGMIPANEEWTKLPTYVDGKVIWVFTDTLTTKEPIFKIPK